MRQEQPLAVGVGLDHQIPLARSHTLRRSSIVPLAALHDALEADRHADPSGVRDVLKMPNR